MRMCSMQLMMMVCLFAFAAAETTVAQLDEAEEFSFPALEIAGNFQVSVGALEESATSRRLGSSASVDAAVEKGKKGNKELGNFNKDFVCPEGGDPEKWITEIPVQNSVAKVHCVTGVEGSGKNHDGLSFDADLASGKKKDYPIQRSGVGIPLDGDVKEGESLGVTLPCTVSAVADGKAFQPFMLSSQELSSLDDKEEKSEAMFQAIEGTKSCAATTTFYRTGGLRMGTGGTNGGWEDLIWARIVKLVVCVQDSSKETFGKPGRKCAEAKRVTQCNIGDDRKTAKPCHEGGVKVDGEAAINFVSML